MASFESIPGCQKLKFTILNFVNQFSSCFRLWKCFWEFYSFVVIGVCNDDSASSAENEILLVIESRGKKNVSDQKTFTPSKIMRQRFVSVLVFLLSNSCVAWTSSGALLWGLSLVMSVEQPSSTSTLTTSMVSPLIFFSCLRCFKEYPAPSFYY